MRFALAVVLVVAVTTASALVLLRLIAPRDWVRISRNPRIVRSCVVAYSQFRRVHPGGRLSPSFFHYTIALNPPAVETRLEKRGAVRVAFVPRAWTEPTEEVAAPEEVHVIVDERSFRVIKWHFVEY